MMNSLKPIVGLASIAALFLTLTPVAYGATIALRPSAGATTQLLAASVQGRSCSIPHTDAAISGTPFFEMPKIAEEMGKSGTSVVQVDLLPNGALEHYALRQSSGNVALDDSALLTARMTKYDAETQNCVAIPGSYLLVVDF